MVDISPAEMRLAELQLLSACPFCGYALRGLPTLHRCPECGKDCDRRWQCYGAHVAPAKSRVGARALRFLIIGIVFFYGFGALATIFFLSALPPLLIVVELPLLLGALAWLVFLNPRQFVAIGPDGLTVVRGRGRIDRFEWTALGRARNRFPIKRVEVERRAASADPANAATTAQLPPIVIPQNGFFGLNLFEMDRFVREFNAYPRPTE